MGWLGEFFSLEALDTRLQAPADYKKKDAVVKQSLPPRWNTPEFKFYFVAFCFVVPMMLKACMEASNEHNPNYPKYAKYLSQGWIFGRKVDNSDTQYLFFRDNFWLLMALVFGHTLLRKGLNLAVGGAQTTITRTQYDFCFGLIYLVGLHGTSVFKMFTHYVINYAIAKIAAPRLGKKPAALLTWAYGLSTLFLNDKIRDGPIGISWIDSSYMGIIKRWDVFFNFSVLRMISFNMDYIEKLDEPMSEEVVVEGLDDRKRLVAPLPLSDYSFFHYIAYLTYAPLFLAGPVLTFNDYIYQLSYYPLPSVRDFRRIAIYFVRFLFCVLCMEIILHFAYVVAVSKAKAWDGDSPFQISMVGFFNLICIWLKLLIPWRLFRFWALFDGIDPPENMIRCMSNNFSALAFWRAWHRSFNRWVIRYIYVPLGGGGNNRILNSLLVFSFVAIWHDIELRLLFWGWLVVFFLLPEIACTQFFKPYREKWWYRHLAALGCTINIWMMMIANLFGFCLDKDGMLNLLRDLFKTVDGFSFLVGSTISLWIATQVMFERRQGELRRGVNVRC